MAQQDTPAAGSGKASDPQRVANIHAICFIQTDRALERIQDLHLSALKKSNYRDTTTNCALWAAFCALSDELHRHLRDAQSDGKLLTCWRGSAVEAWARNPGFPA